MNDHKHNFMLLAVIIGLGMMRPVESEINELQHNVILTAIATEAVNFTVTATTYAMTVGSICNTDFDTVMRIYDVNGTVLCENDDFTIHQSHPLRYFPIQCSEIGRELYETLSTIKNCPVVKGNEYIVSLNKYDGVMVEGPQDFNGTYTYSILRDDKIYPACETEDDVFKILDPVTLPTSEGKYYFNQSMSRCDFDFDEPTLSSMKLRGKTTCDLTLTTISTEGAQVHMSIDRVSNGNETFCHNVYKNYNSPGDGLRLPVDVPGVVGAQDGFETYIAFNFTSNSDDPEIVVQFMMEASNCEMSQCVHDMDAPKVATHNLPIMDTIEDTIGPLYMQFGVDSSSQPTPYRIIELTGPSGCRDVSLGIVDIEGQDSNDLEVYKVAVGNKDTCQTVEDFTDGLEVYYSEEMGSFPLNIADAVKNASSGEQSVYVLINTKHYDPDFNVTFNIFAQQCDMQCNLPQGWIGNYEHKHDDLDSCVNSATCEMVCGTNNTIMANVTCNEYDGVFELSGCADILPNCTLPESIDNIYELLEDPTACDDTVSCSASCAAGHIGSATVTCNTDTMQWEFSGCAVDTGDAMKTSTLLASILLAFLVAIFA